MRILHLHDGIANHCQTWSLENSPTQEITGSSVSNRKCRASSIAYRVGSLLALWPSIMTGNPLTSVNDGMFTAYNWYWPEAISELHKLESFINYP